MRINSDEAIQRAREDFQRYGRNWFNVLAAAKERDDGVLVIPRPDHAAKVADKADK